MQYSIDNNTLCKSCTTKQNYLDPIKKEHYNNKFKVITDKEIIEVSGLKLQKLIDNNELIFDKNYVQKAKNYIQYILRKDDKHGG